MALTRPLNELSTAEAARAIAAGDVTSEALTRACLARIEARESVVRAWAAIDADRALEEARRRDGETSRGPLHGVPIGVKDVLDTFDYPTRMGSPIYENNQTPGDASCVAILRAAGAVILGKTVTCEFAGVAPGPTTHPFDASRTPGGSSSGSAAAVADMMVPVALGTQTGGSVLRPASFCGLVGYKPTYGAFNRQGLKFAAESLDTIGLIARDIADVALVADVLVGREPAPVAPLSRPPRLGLCRTYLWDEKASSETRECVERVVGSARRAGARVDVFDLPGEFARLTQAREIINDVERARSLAWEWAWRRDALSPQLHKTIERGLARPDESYRSELRFAENARLRLDVLLANYDGLIAPCVNGEAPVGLHYAGDPAFQGLWTLLHTPTMTLPAHAGPHGLPVGAQIIGRRWDDQKLMALAMWLRDVAGVGAGVVR